MGNVQETASIAAGFLRRTWRGLISMLGAYTFPLGYWWCRSVHHLQSRQRLEQGLVLVLPGIQGKSPMEFAVARGLADAGVEQAIEIFDWTTRLWPLLLLHLRAGLWHRFMARRLAKRIEAYQTQYPGRPVYLIGHSGGAALSLLAAERLPRNASLAGIVLLAPAMSPLFDLRPAAARCDTIWNYCSPLDCLLLGVGTTVAGSVDGWHCIAAGMAGFWGATRQPENLRQHWYHPRMLLSWNGGGHFGCVNRVFIGDHVGPLLREHAQSLVPAKPLMKRAA